MGNGWVMVSPQQFFFDVLSSHTHCSSMSLLHRSKSFMTCSVMGCCPEFRTALSFQQGYSTGFKGTSAPAPRAPPPSLTGMFTGIFLSVFSSVLDPIFCLLYWTHFARATHRSGQDLCGVFRAVWRWLCPARHSPGLSSRSSPATAWASEPGTARYVLILTESS